VAIRSNSRFQVSQPRGEVKHFVLLLARCELSPRDGAALCALPGAGNFRRCAHHDRWNVRIRRRRKHVARGACGQPPRCARAWSSSLGLFRVLLVGAQGIFTMISPFRCLTTKIADVQSAVHSLALKMTYCGARCRTSAVSASFTIPDCVPQHLAGALFPRVSDRQGDFNREWSR